MVLTQIFDNFLMCVLSFKYDFAHNNGQLKNFNEA